MRAIRLSLPLIALLGLAACGQGGMNPQTRNIVGGTAGGAALGGIIGSFSGDAGFGALLGAGAGAGAGYLYDQSQRNSRGGYGYDRGPRGRRY